MKSATQIGVLLLLLAGFYSPVVAAGGVGMGVILGDPTGISGKLWLTDRQAIAGAVAWSFRGESALHIHGDYLFHHDLSPNLQQKTPPVRPEFYYGIGGRIKDERENRISLRMPVGIAGRFTGAPVELYMEIVPMLDLAPASEFDMNAALGARFYF